MNYDIKYYPFGMLQPDMYAENEDPRTRFGFNGMLRDDDIKDKFSTSPDDEGRGNSYATHFRMYDPRVARWFSIDPLVAQFPWTSPYTGMGNNPVNRIDPMGDADSEHDLKEEMKQTNPMYTYMSEEKTHQKFEAGKQLIKDAFDYSFRLSATIIGGEANIQIGPLRAKGGASVFDGNVKTSNENLLDVTGKFLNASLDIGFASAKLEGSVSSAKGNITLKHSGDLKYEGKVLPNPQSGATLGSTGFEMNIDNSARIGIGGKTGPVKIGAGVNLGKLKHGTKLLIEAGFQYIREVKSKMSN